MTARERLASARAGRFGSRVPANLEPTAWARRLAELRASGARLLDLTESNPTRVGLADLGKADLAALADPRAARYEPEPRGILSAREAVAGYYVARGIEISADSIVLTTGTSESYAHLFRLLAEPGDVVLVPAPSYPLFEPIAALEGVRVSTYRLDYEGRWMLDLESVKKAIAASQGRAKALVTVEPNHPTGSCLTTQERAALEGLCSDSGLALISDEVFGDFPWPPRDRPLPSLLESRGGSPARPAPTFVLGGLSKSCGMPQLKLGWIAVRGRETERRRLLEPLEWVADLFLSVGTPVQLALPRLLESGRAYRARVGERLATHLDLLRRFTERVPAAERLHGEGGWSAIVRVPATRSAEEWALALLEREVVVHPGYFYDLESEAHLVIGLITEPATLGAGLERLEALLTET